MRQLITLCLAVAFGFMIPFSVAHAQTAATDIQQAETYLRNLNTVKADFIQKDYNGNRMTGTFYLDRPGKLRFEYDQSNDFIVADGFFIYFYDSEMQEQSNAPIGQTLADFLLRENLKLTGDVTVTNISNEGIFKTISIVETSDPSAGLVKLYFSQNPYALKMWQVTDAAGLTTEITLREAQYDLPLPSRLFVYLPPKQDKPTYN